MNISKNLLSLGLIAVISGISTAQTYTATAGTNGVTDIQSDYSQATGDGASVSVDVPLEFELPKKIALAFVDESGGMTANPLFSEVQNGGIVKGYRGKSHISFNANTAGDWFGPVFAFYSNSDNNVITYSNKLDFIHETDSSSVISTPEYTDASTHCHLHNGAESTRKYIPNNYVLDINEMNNNQAVITPYYYLDQSTIEATDRAGKYITSMNITISVL